MCPEVQKFAKEKFKIKNEMLEESSKDALLSKDDNNDIWKWHINDFFSYLTLHALPLSFTIYNILSNSESDKILWKRVLSGEKEF